MQARIEELSILIDEAMANGNQGEAEELYAEQEELCSVGNAAVYIMGDEPTPASLLSSIYDS